jgi:hypothetical protein
LKLGILAVDYDGTIAKDGVLDPDVRAAIEELRATGIAVILVTGRILDQLRGLIGDLRLFDAIVAENGAVVAFPNTGRSTLLGHSPQPAFLEELKRRGIRFERGECVVEADSNLAHEILSVIRDLELPLVLLFNRGRLMVLPQAISKATGLRHALRTMRLSEHFVFVHKGKPTGRRARTLKEFAAILAVAPSEIIDGHLLAGDFSRWIGGVFRDNALASQIQYLEQRYVTGQIPDINDALIQLVQDRYKLYSNA